MLYDQIWAYLTPTQSERYPRIHQIWCFGTSDPGFELSEIPQICSNTPIWVHLETLFGGPSGPPYWAPGDTHIQRIPGMAIWPILGPSQYTIYAIYEVADTTCSGSCIWTSKRGPIYAPFGVPKSSDPGSGPQIQDPSIWGTLNSTIWGPIWSPFGVHLGHHIRPPWRPNIRLCLSRQIWGCSRGGLHLGPQIWSK